jgi:hypothetical protein
MISLQTEQDLTTDHTGREQLRDWVIAQSETQKLAPDERISREHSEREWLLHIFDGLLEPLALK